jgi:hypothetical protein
MMLLILSQKYLVRYYFLKLNVLPFYFFIKVYWWEAALIKAHTNLIEIFFEEFFLNLNEKFLKKNGFLKF